MTVGADLEPGEYTVRLRRKDPNAAGSGQFRITIRKTGQ